MSDAEKQLEQLKQAIYFIENGAQSYTIGSSTVTKANLSTLYNRQKYLENQVEQENGGTRRIAVFMDR